jgi:hypothetical protein
LFDPAKYYELVTDILWSRNDEIFLDPNTGFNVSMAQGRWDVILWRADLHFENTGHILEIYETYSRDTGGKALRRRNYRLVAPEGNQIFLFDTHGRECGFDEPCHVHTSTGEEFENGHGRLCGYDLADMDFSRVFRLAYRYIFESEKLPWE